MTHILSLYHTDVRPPDLLQAAGAWPPMALYGPYEPPTDPLWTPYGPL